CTARVSLERGGNPPTRTSGAGTTFRGLGPLVLGNRRRDRAVSTEGREGMKMALWGGIAGIARVTRRCDGLWRFLIVRAKGRTAVELERERNRATAEVIRLLSNGDELLEFETKGRLR